MALVAGVGECRGPHNGFARYWRSSVGDLVALLRKFFVDRAEEAA